MPSKRKTTASDASQTPSKKAALAQTEPPAVASSKKRKAASESPAPKNASKKKAPAKMEAARAPSPAKVSTVASNTPNKKAVATSKSILNSAANASPSSAKKGVRIVDNPFPAKPMAVVAPPRHAVRAAPSKQPKPAAVHGETSIDDTVPLWRHFHGSLQIVTSTLGPLFLAVIVVCYVLSAYEQSRSHGKSAQLVASVGVLFFIVYLALISAFVLLLVPAILLTKVFGMFVGNEGDRAFLRAHKLELYSLSLLGGASAAYAAAGLNK